MSTQNLSLLAERTAEIRAHAEASMVARILGELIEEPSSKRFAHSRPMRIERWAQLQSCAAKQVSGLQALAKQTVRKPRGGNIQSVPKGTSGLVPDANSTVVTPTT